MSALTFGTRILRVPLCQWNMNIYSQAREPKAFASGHSPRAGNALWEIKGVE